MSNDKVDILADELSRIRDTIKPSEDPAWRRAAALRVIDCVLSLNRNYDKFLVPRLDRFELENPTIKTVNQLQSAMESATSPKDYVVQHLNYRDENRSKTLFEVTRWLALVAGEGSYEEQFSNLSTWASLAKPDGYKALKIRGFGVAGWQYLRMLFGANTTKPDVHIIRFAEGITGAKLNAERALMVLEAASDRVGISLRDLDTVIWEKSARPQKV